jgi:hypothetical protein
VTGAIIILVTLTFDLAIAFIHFAVIFMLLAVSEIVPLDMNLTIHGVVNGNIFDTGYACYDVRGKSLEWVLVWLI